MSGASSPEDRQIELLATYDEALSSGSTLEGVLSNHLNDADRRRFEDNQKCLQLLEQLFPRQSVPAALTPRQFGRFHIVRELGRGGFGIVYLAEDPVLCRQVALKVPRMDVLIDAQLRDRFLREAKAAGQLDHPNLVRVLDAGCAGLVYIVSDYCPGPTLAQWLKQNRPCSPRLAAQIVAAVARAAAYIHSQGILHRDIKPGNILLAPTRDRPPASELPFTPRLTDFGLARLMDRDVTQTVSGAILGTPAYMAPEQARGQIEEIGQASDIYSLGAVLYELCTGQAPFAGQIQADQLRRLVSEDVAAPRSLRPALPRDLEAICLKCLEKRTINRYDSAESLANDLENYLAARSTVARPVSLWVRGTRRIRRRPALSAAVGLAALMLLFTALMMANARRRQEAYNKEVLAFEQLQKQQAAELKHQREEYLELEQELDYVSGIRAAAKHLQENRGIGADKILNGYRPTTDAADHREFAWRYLWRQGARSVVLKGHKSVVEMVAFSGEDLVSTSHEGLVRWWDLELRQPRRDLRRNPPSAGNICASPDGRRVVTYWPYDGPAAVACWDTETGVLVGELRIPEVAQFAFRSFDRRVTIGARDTDSSSMLIVWDPDQGETEVIWKKPISASQGKPFVCGLPTALQYSPDGAMLAFAYEELVDGRAIGVCELMAIQADKATTPFYSNRHLILAIAFSPAGDTVAISNWKGDVNLFKVATGECLARFTGIDDPVRCLAFSPDGKLLACGMNWPDLTVQEDKEYVVLWDLARKTRYKSAPFRGVTVLSVDFSTDGSSLALGCGDHTVRVWDLAEVEDSGGRVIRAHAPAEAWGVAFAPDGPIMATCGDDHLARLWDIRTHKEIAVCTGAPSLLLAAAFAADRPLLATAGYDGVVRIWDANTGKEEHGLLGHEGPVRSVAFSPDRKLLASAGDDKTVKIWDWAQHTLLYSLDGHTDKVRQVVFSPDGRRLFSGGNDDMIFVWEPDSGLPLYSFPVNAEVAALAHSPEQALIAIGTEKPEIELRSSDSWEIKARLAGHAQGARCVAFSPDGKTLASGGFDCSVRLWHVATGQELLAFENLPAQINGVAFNSDGSTLAATCHDGSVRLWQTRR